MTLPRPPARIGRNEAVCRGSFVNLHAMLLEREAAGRLVTVGLIGAGKFGTMFLAQARSTRGLHVVGVADLDARQTPAARRRLGRADHFRGLARRRLQDRPHPRHPRRGRLDRVSGDRGDRRGDRDPPAGIRHALRAIAHGKHIVMVNVEADAVAGPLLARKAKSAGVVYSLAWGDQPAR